MDQLVDRPVVDTPVNRNGAPLQPLLEAARGGTRPAEASSLTKALQELYKHHYRLQQRARNAMVSAGYENALFMEGKQILRPNPFAPGQWIPFTPKRPGTVETRIMNFFRFYTTNSLWKWQLSNPDVVAIAGINTEKARESAEAADTIIEYHERRYFKPIITIQEGLNGLCWGSYVWEVYYDNTQHSITALQPIFGMTEVVGGTGWGQCGQCGYSGGADTFQQVQPDPFSPPMSLCPQCGGESMVEQPPTEMMPTVVGQQEVKLGQLTAKLRPFPECHWDFNHRVEESSWFIHLQQTSVQAIRRLLGDIKIPNSGVDTDDFGLRVMNNLAWCAGGAAAMPDKLRKELYADPAVVGTYSLGPDDYAHIILSKAEQCADGSEIPAGPLLNTYPNGLTIQHVNGVALILNLTPTHHSRTFTGGVWHAKPGSGTGQGLDDLREVQKGFNRSNTQISTFFDASATPAMLVLKEALGDTDPGYLGTGNINIPIIGQNLPEGMKPEDVVRPAFQPQSVPGQLFALTYQHMNNFAQITSHITDFSGGLPGVNNSTATGAQITQANSNALFTPPLQVKGEVRLRIAEITLDLYREHFPVERPFPLKGRHGRMQYRFFSAANLGTEVSLEVVKDSELPRNMFTKREDMFAFLQMLGGAAGYIQLREMDPEFIIELERAFNVNVKSETYNQVSSLCQQRLIQLQTVVDVAPDPTVLTGLAMLPPMGEIVQALPGVIDPPIALEEPEHDLQAKWYSEWLVEDEGLAAGPVVRAAVILLIRYHFQLDGIQKGEIAFQQGSVMAAAEAPQAIGQAMGQAVNNEVNPVPDVNNDVPDVNKPSGKVTGRPKPKSAR